MRERSSVEEGGIDGWAALLACLLACVVGMCCLEIKAGQKGSRPAGKKFVPINQSISEQASRSFHSVQSIEQSIKQSV